MTAIDFLTILNENILLAIISIFISAVTFVILLKNRVKSITDPLLITIIFTIFANSVPIILYLTNNISHNLFTYFIFSEFAFWSIFYIFSTKYKHSSFLHTYKKLNEKPLFVIFISIYIIANIWYFKINGFPILNTNRFEQHIDNSSGILGILLRLSSLASLFVHIYIIHLFKINKKEIAITCFLICIIISFLHGSKSFILGFVKAYFFYYLFYMNKKPNIKSSIIFVIIITPILTLIIGNNNDVYSAIIGFLYRLIASGDVYWNAYCNNTINSIFIENPISNMTYFLWGPLRHIFPITYDTNTMTTAGSLAFEISSGFYPDGGAPNSRLSFLSYVYYKWNGILLCCFFGYFSAKVYNKCIRKNNIASIGKTTIKGLLYTSIFLIPVDPYLFFNSLYSIFFFMFIYKFYCSLLKPKSKCIKYQL